MEAKLNQILEVVQVINNKTSTLQQENEKLKKQNEVILKRIDDLELEISNIPKEVKVIKKQEYLTIKDILKENPQIKKTTLYRYFQNHTANGLKVIQKDEGGTYTIKREDWDIWYNSQFSIAFDFINSKSTIESIIEEDDNSINAEEKIKQIKKILTESEDNNNIEIKNSNKLDLNL